VVLIAKANARCMWKRASGSLTTMRERMPRARAEKTTNAKVLFLWNAAALCVGEGDGMIHCLHTRQQSFACCVNE
jgi:hypothetical protein